MHHSGDQTQSRHLGCPLPLFWFYLRQGLGYLDSGKVQNLFQEARMWSSSSKLDTLFMSITPARTQTSCLVLCRLEPRPARHFGPGPQFSTAQQLCNRLAAPSADSWITNIQGLTTIVHSDWAWMPSDRECAEEVEKQRASLDRMIPHINIVPNKSGTIHLKWPPSQVMKPLQMLYICGIKTNLNRVSHYTIICTKKEHI